MDKRTGRDQWINARMKKLLADAFCPACGRHNVLHNDKKCAMRYTKEESNGWPTARRRTGNPEEVLL